MTITEISKKYNLSQDTLRYYERVGLIPPVKRSSRGNRDYDQESCTWIEMAKCMRQAGVPIEVLIEYCDLTRQGDETISHRKQLLIMERDKLQNKIDAMQETLKHLDDKIKVYENAEITGELPWENPFEKQKDEGN